jgi:tetrathionate reductase subunit B
MDRREFLKTAGGSVLLATSCAYAFRFLTSATGVTVEGDPSASDRQWGMVIDLNKCVDGCTDCLTACRTENNVAFHDDPKWDIHWIRKVKVKGRIGNTETEQSVLLLCNHCENPPCAQVCPVQATYKRADGIVIVDHHRCVGCRYCMIACPYNARFFNFKDHEHWTNPKRPKRSHGVAEACTLCAHRLDVNEDPACVEACKKKGVGALAVGNLKDEHSKVSTLIANNSVKRIKEDLGTEPKVYYMGL